MYCVINCMIVGPFNNSIKERQLLRAARDNRTQNIPRVFNCHSLPIKPKFILKNWGVSDTQSVYPHCDIASAKLLFWTKSRSTGHQESGGQGGETTPTGRPFSSSPQSEPCWFDKVESSLACAHELFTSVSAPACAQHTCTTITISQHTTSHNDESSSIVVRLGAACLRQNFSRRQDSGFALCFHCLRGGKTLPLLCVCAAFVAKTLPFLAVKTCRARGYRMVRNNGGQTAPTSAVCPPENRHRRTHWRPTTINNIRSQHQKD